MGIKCGQPVGEGGRANREGKALGNSSLPEPAEWEEWARGKAWEGGHSIPYKGRGQGVVVVPPTPAQAGTGNLGGRATGKPILGKGRHVEGR